MFFVVFYISRLSHVLFAVPRFIVPRAFAFADVGVRPCVLCVLSNCCSCFGSCLAFEFIFVFTIFDILHILVYDIV